jgi:mRNA interferase MazF
VVTRRGDIGHGDVGRGMVQRGDVQRGDVRRGDIFWADVGGRRPVVVVQAQPYNDSRLPTVLAAVITSNTAFATMPGSVFLPAAGSGLTTDAVVDVTALVTLSKTDIEGPIGAAPAEEMAAVDAGLRRVLGL